MKVVDANILIYAADSDSLLHDAARAWWKKSLGRISWVHENVDKSQNFSSTDVSSACN